PPSKNALINLPLERVDSDRTDESPFGSALTTPVDEDVVMFRGIEQRLIGKDVEGEGGYVMEGCDVKEVKRGSGGVELNAASAASEVDLLGTLNKADSILEETGGESTLILDEKLASNLDIQNHTQEPAETAKDLLSLLPFAQHSPTLDTARSRSLLILALRILIFLPWCPIAGASILLFPTHLERIIFGPGFVSSPQGIHRFAFWTDVSKELVGAFLGAVLVVWCVCPAAGRVLLGVALVRFRYAWRGFRMDRKIPVGQDDMQSLYWVFRLYVAGDVLGSLREEDDGAASRDQMIPRGCAATWLGCLVVRSFYLPFVAHLIDMLWRLCGPDSGLLDFYKACTRSAWAALVPFVVVLVLGLCVIPGLPVRVPKVLRTFVRLDEAEAFAQPTPTLRRPLLFISAGLFSTLIYLSHFSYILIASSSLPLALPSLLLALSWLYTVLRPALSPTQTVPYDLFAVYTALFAGAVLLLGGVYYEKGVFGAPWPDVRTMGALWGNLGVTAAMLGVVLGMPLALPGQGVKPEDIGTTVSPEDYTSLFGWITFSWVYPLVQRGRNTTLDEKSVWDLSPTMQSRIIFRKFAATPAVSLLRKLIITNFLDLFLDLVLTLISVSFNYTGPFFLKRILDSIDHPEPTPSSRAQAYIYALLAFLCALLKSQADLQHLWFGRRAGTRMRSELMAGIYDKALKRRDFSGVVGREKEGGVEGRKGGKTGKGKGKGKDKGKEDENDPKAGADVGKIVNLMAGDANRVSMTISAMYFIYGAPLEIIIASTFLYNLLGLSAFAGFLVLLLGWPLNSYIARRAIRIQKGWLAARDRRMGVLSELVGAVRFVKFFAWEGRWVDRVMRMREGEIAWMVRGEFVMLGGVSFSRGFRAMDGWEADFCGWGRSEDKFGRVFAFVDLCADFDFDHFVLCFCDAGERVVDLYGIYGASSLCLSVLSYGFPLLLLLMLQAIALFNMVRAPLNVIPTWIVQILQTGVALNRIAVYLAEDEVDEQVSSLKKDALSPSPSLPPPSNSNVVREEEIEGLGIERGSFKWNEVDRAERGNVNTNARSVNASESAETVVGVGENGEGEGQMDVDVDHKFELRDINVRFPEGELTLITGPTASGKTALLVRSPHTPTSNTNKRTLKMALLGEMTLLRGHIVMSKTPTLHDTNGHTLSLSYASQTPWLQHQSIRSNILFNAPFDAARYNAVIDACALRPDLDVLEDGDMTEIGARGVSLSGGQKARVALARAVYDRARWVVLDDPLSAVDSGTAGWIVERLLGGELLRGRTVILVTHHVDLVLPVAQYVVRMLDGRIDMQGSVKDLRARGVLEEIQHESAVNVAEAEVKEQEQEALVETPDEDGEMQELEESSESGNANGTEGEGERKERKKPRKLVKDEHREVGGVKWAIYQSYLKASYVVFFFFTRMGWRADEILGMYRSYWIWVFLAMLVVVSQLLGVGEKVWIMIWGEAYKDDTPASLYYTFTSFTTKDSHDLHVDGYHPSHFRSTLNLPSIQTLFIKEDGRFGINWPRALEHPFFYIGIYAGIGLLNVLDIETIDSSLAGSLQAVNTSLANFFASIILVASVFPWFLVPAIFLGFAYRELSIGYLNTGRDLRRMESNSRSPIFSDFGELLEGIVTVRAFSAERRFLDNLHKKIDLTTKVRFFLMWYSFWMTNRWLLLNFDALGALAVLITMLFSISTLANGAGLAGICITSAMAFTTSGGVLFVPRISIIDANKRAAVYWACRFWTALELDLNSIEHVAEYLDLPQESPAIIESNRSPAYWPSSSNNDSLVVVEDLKIKYAPDLPAILQNVSSTLKAGEEQVDPTRLTFIPQDATLFLGTLRKILDPFNEHTDAECLDMLQRCHMISTPSAS
ncbi:hypothetical protein C0995_002341, partial [Termitomyces sp. Mi166